MGQLARIGRAVSTTIEILIGFGKVATLFLGFPLSAMIFPKNPIAFFVIGFPWFVFFVTYFLDEGD